MIVLARLDYARLRPLKNGIYVTLILSILAVLAVGHSAKGAQRAISLPFFSFQASELGKVLLILALSALVVDRARRLRERDTTARVMLAALVPAMFVIAQPDLGSGIVYMVIAFVALLVAGTPGRHLAALLALVAVSLTFVLVAAPAVGVHVLKSYQVERLTAFVHPSANIKAIKESESKTGEPDPLYQLLESKIAIGSGQKTGRSGSGGSQVPLGYVPESHTDFVFAAVGEQYGFVGAGLVLCLYALLIWRTLRILTMSKDLFGSLIAAGVAAMLMFQVFVNVGMTVGIMPITGVTLPLMSYGGSSVITTFLAVGLLQSIYVRARASAALKGRVPLY
jgi:rod shape determining protein RodA